MAEKLEISVTADKACKYEELYPQLEALLGGEDDMIANCANVSAALKEVFDWLWVGFYFVKNEVMVLGPFQGSIACTRIGYGRGVCGRAWKERETLVVPDVDAFTDHIVCDSRARSEIVIPMILGAEVIGVLDVDSDRLNTFDAVDQQYLEKIVALLLSCSKI